VPPDINFTSSIVLITFSSVPLLTIVFSGFCSFLDFYLLGFAVRFVLCNRRFTYFLLTWSMIASAGLKDAVAN